MKTTIWRFCTPVGLQDFKKRYIRSRDKVSMSNKTWIRVEDELPPSGELVLTYAANAIYWSRRVNLNILFEDIGWQIGTGVCTPSHWMPIPEPPGGEDDKEATP